MENNIEKISETFCTGCKMCGDICPHKAIKYEINSEGYWYPVCDGTKCTDCGLCISKCPVREGAVVYDTERISYVAWSNDDVIRRKSTSGGLYYEFARKVLDNGGYIVGSVYSEDYRSAYHIVTNNEDDLQRVMGSKYFQSDTEGIYEKVATIVKAGKKVLFTGTPCQIAAIDTYLGRKYENLILVDFLCRGVPSPALQSKKIELYEKKAHAKVVYYSDKTKPYGWNNFGETIRFSNGKEKFISRWKDDINDCFIEKNLNLRESCYNCRFKDGNRAADITIGDFWGIKGVTEKDQLYGASCLITNTKKGEDFIDSLGDCIYKGVRPINEVSASNKAYIESANRPKERDLFFEQVMNDGLAKTVERYSDYTIKRLIKREIKALKGIILSKYPTPKSFRDLNIIKFIYYNYFCPQVHRSKNAYIMPYKGSYLEISKTANIYLNGNLFINYYPCYERGTNMTRVRVGDNARLNVNNRVELAYGNTFSLDKNSEMNIGYFYTGVGANVICQYKMNIGNNVMFGRDVCAFDSDYHCIMNSEGIVINDKKEVIIEDNCWIGARSMVLKGSHIRQGAIVSANSMVMGDVEGNRVYINKREAKSIGNNIIWER